MAITGEHSSFWNLSFSSDTKDHKLHNTGDDCSLSMLCIYVIHSCFQITKDVFYIMVRLQDWLTHHKIY